VLSDTKITATWHSLGRKFEQEFALSRLNPVALKVKRHFPLLVYIPTAIAAVAALLMGILLQQDLLPEEAVYLIGIPIILSAIWHAFKGLPRVEFVRFRDKAGVLLFDVVKGEHQSEEYECFVTELIERIKAQSSTPGLDS